MNIYFGLALPADSVFDTELVSKAIFDLQCGIVPDTNRTTEHLIRAHPILPVVLSKLKLFKLSLLCKQVPCNVNVNVNLYSASSQKNASNALSHLDLDICSYIVSLPKLKDCITKVISCEDFSGIAISSAIISKVSEYCFIDKFGEFINTDNKQFGLKRDGL